MQSMWIQSKCGGQIMSEQWDDDNDEDDENDDWPQNWDDEQ